jgi:hypothetical protein
LCPAFFWVLLMRQAIQQRTSESLGTKDTGPFIERQIAGYQGGAILVATTDHLEQQLCANCRKGHITELINNQYFVGSNQNVYFSAKA